METIETPSEGRATIEETLSGEFKITIPAEKNWPTTIFLGFWLCGWTVGEIVVCGVVIRGIIKMAAPQFFLIFWLCGWTIGGAFAFSILIWRLAGKEIITIGQGRLNMIRKAALFFRPKTYDLSQAKNFRVQEDTAGYNSFGSGRDYRALYGGGTIRFDYGMKTVKFGSGLEEAEAISILNRLASQKIIKYPA